MAKAENSGIIGVVERPSYHVSTSLVPIAQRNQPLYQQTKRALDLILTSVLLIFVAPLAILIAIAIKLDSSGPVIYSQQRMGYDWRQRRLRAFTLYKFRSMCHDSDESIHRQHIQDRIRAQTQNGPESDTALAKLVDDSRITPMGRLMRRTSMDELPQLWNVLRGDMSLVGPRPVPLYEVAEYEPWHRQRLQAMPGITGLWQVTGRGRASVDEMARLDIEYINRQSIWLDLMILLRTIRVVINGEGAS